MVNNVEVITTVQEVGEKRSCDYHEKLQTCEEASIPNLIQLYDCWLDEDLEIKPWLSAMYPNIFNFLAFHPAELATTDLDDYKASRTYSYYSDRLLERSQCSKVSKEAKYCFITSTCRPSKRINDAAHKLWIWYKKMAK